MSTPTLDDDREKIVHFQWIDDEDEILPVDPDDPDALKRAIRWATRQYNALDHERFMSENMAALYPEDAESIYLADMRAMGLFRAALIRTYHAMEQRDRAKLAAWNAGEPVKVEE